MRIEKFPEVSELTKRLLSESTPAQRAAALEADDVEPVGVVSVFIRIVVNLTALVHLNAQMIAAAVGELIQGNEIPDPSTMLEETAMLYRHIQAYVEFLDGYEFDLVGVVAEMEGIKDLGLHLSQEMAEFHLTKREVLKVYKDRWE